MIIEDLEQRSAEWLEMRKGMVTGSMVAHVMGKMKRQKPNEPVKYLQRREDYMFDLAVTRLTGLMPDRYVSNAMQFGTENEPFARAAYEMEFGVMVEEVGFAMHPRINWFGASPDGLVGGDGVLEIKCPNSATHLEYLLAGEVPEQYIPQMKALMLCAERQWCDFVSFDPRMPPDLQLFVRRLERDEPMLVELEYEVEKFLGELDALMLNLRRVPMVARCTQCARNVRQAEEKIR